MFPLEPRYCVKRELNKIAYSTIDEARSKNKTKKKTANIIAKMYVWLRLSNKKIQRKQTYTIGKRKLTQKNSIPNQTACTLMVKFQLKILVITFSRIFYCLPARNELYNRARKLRKCWFGFLNALYWSANVRMYFIIVKETCKTVLVMNNDREGGSTSLIYAFSFSW